MTQRHEEERGEWGGRDDERGERASRGERGSQRPGGQAGRGHGYPREEQERWEAEGGRSPNRGFERDRSFGEQDWSRGAEQERGQRQGGYPGSPYGEYGRWGGGGQGMGRQFGGEDPQRRGDERERGYGGGTGSRYGSSEYGAGRYSGAQQGWRGGPEQEWSGGGQQGWRGGREFESGGGQESWGERAFESGGRGGQRFGQPPKGYKRSDERIREDVCDTLMRRSHLDASEVEVQVRDGEVTLQGSVSDRRAKFEIEHLADSIPGVKDVTNSLRIKREDASRGSATSSTSGSTSEEGRTGGGRSQNVPHSPRG
jgi:osmotically-inducible protein OsmY